MGQFWRQVKLSLMLCLSSVSLTSCMLGPNFHAPSPPATENYTPTPMPSKTTRTLGVGQVGKSQEFIWNQTQVPMRWWELYHSRELNELVAVGLAHNNSVASAQAALRVAQENLNAQIGALMFPNISGQMGIQRQRINPAEYGTPGAPASLTTLYNPAINLNYTLDFFGANRRTLEALGARVDNADFVLQSTYLNLTANIVTMAISAASYREQIITTHQTIQLQRNQLNIVRKQLRLGAVSGIDVLSQESALAETESTLPYLEQNYQASIHALAVLLGIPPSDNHFPTLALRNLTLPRQLPVTLPSVLVRQRPDIRASEALLHAASAQIGVATANLFPQINLTGSYGYLTATPSHIFKASAAVWNFGGTLTQPIFNGGSLRAQRRAAIAAYEQAEANYHQVVLQAFQNVADTLRAIQNDANLLRIQSSAVRTASQNLKITQDQYNLGGVNYLSLLTAQRQYQQAKLGKIRATAGRYMDAAALFQALGGGWGNGTQ